MYEKPIAYVTDDIAEGIYLASGSTQESAWNVSCTNVCWNCSDRNYQVTVSLAHSGDDDNKTQRLHIIFGQTVSVKKCDGGCLVGSGCGVTQVDIDLNNLSGCSKEWKGLAVATSCHNNCSITKAWITSC